MTLLEEIYQFGPQDPHERLFLMELALHSGPNRRSARSLFGIRSGTRSGQGAINNENVRKALVQDGWIKVGPWGDSGHLEEYIIADIDPETREPQPFDQGGPDVQ